MEYSPETFGRLSSRIHTDAMDAHPEQCWTLSRRCWAAMSRAVVTNVDDDGGKIRWRVVTLSRRGLIFVDAARAGSTWTLDFPNGRQPGDIQAAWFRPWRAITAVQVTDVYLDPNESPPVLRVSYRIVAGSESIGIEWLDDGTEELARSVLTRL